MTPTELSAQLKAWRKAKGLTQREAAATLGVGFSTYKEWDQGRHAPAGLGLNTLLEAIRKPE